MNNACPSPAVSAQSDLVQTINAGSTVNYKVSVAGGVNPAYQWYSNTTASTTGGTVVSGATAATYTSAPTFVGTFYLYCMVTNGCGGTPVASPVFTLKVNSNPDILPVGTGSLAGKSCFDIAESNDNVSCGSLTSRQGTQSNFNLAGTNTQTYTFVPVGAVSKVRFSYKESLGGVIVKSISSTTAESALNINAAVTATVVYNSTLSTGVSGQGSAYGKTDDTALKVDLYVVYNNKADGTGTDVQTKVTVIIKDCSCCGALISPTVWKAFLCYNLGADQTVSPYAPSEKIMGDFYKWGYKDPMLTWIAGSNADPAAWGYPKTAKDPCPSGFRLPTGAELKGLVANNTKTLVGSSTIKANRKYDGGILFGSSLYLPFTGTKNGLNSILSYGLWYFSSTHDPDANSTSILYDVTPQVIDSGDGNGGAVRCISEN